jgi:hypothetical protein
MAPHLDEPSPVRTSRELEVCHSDLCVVVRAPGLELEPSSDSVELSAESDPTSSPSRFRVLYSGIIAILLLDKERCGIPENPPPLWVKECITGEG